MQYSEQDLIREREHGRASLRSLYLGELEHARQTRADALALADAQYDRVARLIQDAAAAGLSLAEIARAAGISRPTLYELRGRYSDRERDMRVAVLQAIAYEGRTAPDVVAERLGRPVAELEPILTALEADDCIDDGFNEDPDDPKVGLGVTRKGFEWLTRYWEQWDAEDPDGDR